MPAEWTPDKIRNLRASYKESQPDFAERLNVSVDGFRLWEQDRGVPSGTAQRLLDHLARDLELANLFGIPVDSLAEHLRELAMAPAGRRRTASVG